MKFPNAVNGVKKICLAEALQILAVIMERLYTNKKHSPSGGTASEQELRQVQQFANAIRKEESE